MRKTFFTHSFIWCLVLAFAFTALAQNKEGSATLTARGTSSGTIIGDGTGALLWDNFILPQGTTGIVSGDWQGLPPGSSEVLCADDFVIPGGMTWTIDEIAATGFHSIGFAEVWGVKFYADAGGTPGALLATETVAVVAGVEDPAGLLSNPVVLSGGTYWISVYGIHSTATDLATFRWNWYTSEVAGVGFEPHLIDLAGFFGGTGGVFVTFTSLGIGQYTNLMFQLYGTEGGAVCPVDPPTNPSPADGAVDVPITGNTATWTNGAGATNVEVWFDGAMVYDGTAIESFSLGPVEPLAYSTEYTWQIVGKNDTCGVSGPVWSFTTMDDPDIVNLFMDDFTAGAGNWTITTVSGCPWLVHDISTNGYTLPPTAGGNVMAADADLCGSGGGGSSGDITLTVPVDATLYNTVWVEFDNDWQAIGTSDFGILDVSVDGGATWTNVLTFDVTDVRNTHEVHMLPTLSNITLRFTSIQPGWDWWWAIDNVAIYGSDPIPVELTSFAANVNDGEVTLNWSTATETNNQGFEVQRSSDGVEFDKVGYVAGHGTVTEAQYYVYTDNTVNSGNYSYRLKQIDFNGAFEYSEVVEVEIGVPAVFSLNQNYPNPFNPSTIIEFNLAADSKVTLTVFDVLGQAVTTLINGNLAAGSREITFDASALNSGVYFYRIDATGVDGTNFSSVKKMILTK